MTIEKIYSTMPSGWSSQIVVLRVTMNDGGVYYAEGQTHYQNHWSQVSNLKLLSQGDAFPKIDDKNGCSGYGRLFGQVRTLLNSQSSGK